MQPPDASFFMRKRYLVTFLVFVGWFVQIMLRTNLSISIVDMTSDRIVTIGNETFTKAAEFNWSSVEKGVILSSFSWGYITSPLGVFVANSFGGAVAFGTGIVLTGLLTLFSPILLQWNLTVFLLARFLEGVFEGVATSSCAEIFAQWSPPSERFRLISFINSGVLVGSVLGYPICGTVAYYFNWKAVFYVTGGFSIIWFIIWSALIRNSPINDSLMSHQERMYLKHVNPHISTEKLAHPWKQILTSKAIWAYMNERFMEAWSLSFLTYSLPIFIKDVHDVDIQDIGFISAIPHLCGAIGVIGTAIFADSLKNRGILNVTNVMKLCLGFVQSFAAILLITAALWSNFLVSYVCFSLFRLFYTGASIFYDVMPIYLGGRHACFIMGLGTMNLAFGFALSPVMMGLIVQNHSVIEWSLYFFLLSICNIWGGIIFYKFGSGDLESWAVPPTKQNVEKQSDHKEDLAAF